MPLRDAATPLAVALIWGINIPLMKAGLAHLDPFVFNALRLTLSAIALGVVDRLQPADRPAPAATPWRAIVWCGLLSSFFYQVLFVVGMDATSAGNAAILVASAPIWTAVFARLRGMEHHPTRAWIALGVAFLGTILVTTTGTRAGADAGGATLAGNLAVLAAMLAWAWATVVSRPMLETFPATRLAFLATLVSLPGHWILALPRLQAPEPEHATFLVLTILYSGVLSTGIAYALWNRSVLRFGAARTASLNNLVPVVALLVAWAFLGEVPGAVQVAGGALVVLGLLAWHGSR